MSSSRRSFLKHAAAAGSVALAAHAWGGPKGGPIKLAFVGTGGMGRGHLGKFLSMPGCQPTVICDVDANHLAAARQMAPGAAALSDFREAVTRDDVDAVVVATPDHWHALATIAAAEAGKHVYCEKPLANSVGEGRAIVEATRRTGVVLQTGCHERSSAGAAFAKKIVGEGRLGEIREVRVRLPIAEPHLQEVENLTTPPPDTDPPDGLDYDFWLGHTPAAPYNEKRCHFFWRFHSSFGGGEITDRGAHVLDLAHYVLGLDDAGPIAVHAEGRRPKGEFFDTFISFRFELDYAGGLKVVGDNSGPRGLTLVGSQGELSIAVHGGGLEAKPASLLEGFPKTPIDYYIAYSVHRENWIAAVRGDEAVRAPVEAGHRTASACHLINLAMRLGRPLKWDPATEQSNDRDANALLTPTMRAPWSLG